MVGDSVGLNPLVTLLLLYIGYRMGGILWMILAVPIGMVLINMCQAGAFDYIFDDVRILVDGILGLRGDEREGGKSSDSGRGEDRKGVEK